MDLESFLYEENKSLLVSQLLAYSNMNSQDCSACYQATMMEISNVLATSVFLVRKLYLYQDCCTYQMTIAGILLCGMVALFDLLSPIVKVSRTIFCKGLGGKQAPFHDASQLLILGRYG